MVRATCSALHCNSSSRTHHHFKFHQFPHDAQRRKIWLLACKRTDVIDKDWDFFKYKYVCSKHFQKCMYSKNGNLKRSAMPTLHLSVNHLKHDSFTQTEESIEYVRSDFQQNVAVKEETENAASISYVMPNVEMKSTYTHIGDVPYDFNNVNIKEETITDPKIEDSKLVEQDTEIKTESDDNDEFCDSEGFEDIDMKIDIVENPILPVQQYTQNTDFKIMNTLQENDQSKTATNVNVAKTGQTSPMRTNSINTNIFPTVQIEDKSIQTDRVIVLSQEPFLIEESINPTDCKCPRNTFDDITRAQFVRLCSRFLSPDFCILVKTQMCLDGITKKIENNNSAGPDLDEFFAHQGGITPEVGVAITQMYLDSITKQVGNEFIEAGSTSRGGAGLSKCVKKSAPKCRKVVSPEMFVFDKQMYLDGVRKLITNDVVEAGSSGSGEAGIVKGVKERAAECRKEVDPEKVVAGKQMDLAGLPNPVENDGSSSIRSLAKCDEERAVKRPKVSAPAIVVPCTGITDNVEDDVFDM